MLAASQHREYIQSDFQRLVNCGMTTARTGICWDQIEPRPFAYDFRSVMPIVQAAEATGMQLLWDLFHYGWPDDLNIFSAAFVARFRRLAIAFTHFLVDAGIQAPWLAPLNETSYFSWAAGESAVFYPFARHRGFELKAQLTRAAIEAIDAIWEIAPQARILSIDPVIHVVAAEQHPAEREEAENFRLAQYQAWDLLTGRLWPGLGGHEKYLDVIGVNYYPHNQWIYNGPHLSRADERYRPFHEILQEVADRYQRPIFIAETGAEGDERQPWFEYICDEARTALQAGVDLQGICLYPILDHPGWEDERHCQCGLWGYANEQGERMIYQPLADAIQRQQQAFQTVLTSLPEAGRSADATRPTLCLFTDSLEPSGLGEHMLTLASTLVNHYRILFVCPPSPRGQSVLERAAQLGCIPFALEIPDNPQAYALLEKQLRALNVQIFHCHAGIGWEGHEGVYTAHAINIPHIIRTEHLPYLLTDPEQIAAYRRQLTLVDQLICVSEEAYQSYRAADVPATKICVIPNGVAMPQVNGNQADVRAEFAWPLQAKVILTAARMTPQKGHRYLLESIPNIIQREPNAHFLWVGDGPLSQELAEQRTTLGLAPDQVVFAGWRHDVGRLLAASDLFVLPSLFEGLPLVVLEALALRVPVVATNVCGTTEAIEDGVSGRLVPPEDSHALAEAICWALERPEATAAWSQAGFQRYQQQFSAERMGHDTAALYARLQQQPTKEYQR